MDRQFDEIEQYSDGKNDSLETYVPALNEHCRFSNHHKIKSEAFYSRYALATSTALVLWFCLSQHTKKSVHLFRDRYIFIHKNLVVIFFG